MCTWNRFLAVVGSTLSFVGLAAGDAAAQMRRMPVSHVPAAIQPMPIVPMTHTRMINPILLNSVLPVTPTPLVNPLIGGLSTSLPADPALQYAYMLNRYGGYSMPYGGYSMPYTAPVASYSGAYPTGGTAPMNDIVVKLPIANAKIWINGVETNGTGQSTRHVAVPDSQNHEFTIKATWTIDGKTKSDERTVPLNGSGRQVVNFLVPETR
jgi:hypothetical protein